jgi:hypothetical protein
MVAAEPKILGQPVTFAVYAVGLIHLALCVAIIWNMVIGIPLNIEGVVVSPLLQWIYGAFTLLSIVAIICGGVGALYHIERHLDFYMTVLNLSLCFDIFFCVVFMFYGRACTTSKIEVHRHLSATVSCGIQDGMTLLCLTLLVIFKVLAIFIVHRCKAYVHNCYNVNLITFVKPSNPHPYTYEDHQEPLHYLVEPPKNPIPIFTSDDRPMTSKMNSIPIVTSDQASMRSIPQTIANFLPSMRPNGTTLMPRPVPGSILPSMGPAMLPSMGPPTTGSIPIVDRFGVRSVPSLGYGAALGSFKVA